MCPITVHPMLRPLAAALFAAAVLACPGGSVGHAGVVPGDMVPIAGAVPPLQHTTAGRYLAGRFAESQNDLSSAAELLSPVAGQGGVAERAFLVLLSSGRVGEALDVARGLSSSDRGFVPPRLLLLADAVGTRRFEDAAEMLAGIPSDSFGNGLRPLVEAWVKMGLGEVDEALGALEALRNGALGNNVIILHSALINDLANRTDAAAQLYRESFTSTPAPRRFVRFGVSFFLRQGQPEEAAALYARYLKTDTQNEALHHEAGHLADSLGGLPVVGSSAEGLAEAVFNLATVLVSRNFMPPVLPLLRIALHLKPDFPAAQLMIGDVFRRVERHEEAIAAYRGIRVDTPYHWTGRLRTGHSLEDTGQLSKARDVLEAMAAERPAAIQPLATLGNLLRYGEQFEAAADSYDKAIERIPEAAPEYWFLFYHRGIAHERAKHWVEAEEDLLKAIELNPGDPYLLNYLAYSWVDRNMNLDQALEMLEQALKKQPSAGSIIDSMGWALYRLERFEGAILHLERASSLQPLDSIILDHLGDAYWRVGRRNEARHQWYQALSLDPDEGRIPVLEAKIRDGLQAESGGGSGG